MSIKITLKKGLDININGEAVKSLSDGNKVQRCAIIPDDYPGLTPKIDVKEGDKVLAGAPILHDKGCETLKLVSPVTGIIEAIVRGERRKIERIVILANGSDESVKFNIDKNLSRERVKNLLLNSGLWAMMRQRPYDIVPATDIIPRDIFVTAFDSAPLAPDFEWILNGKKAEIQAGAKALATLTDGKVYMSVRPQSQFADIDGVEIIEVTGAHPAGNAGIQAANIAPVNKGETIWALDAITLMRLGSLILTGEVPMTTTVAVTGSEINAPEYIKTVIGAEISAILNNKITTTDYNHRIISGNVLTGIAIGNDGFLRYPYRQVTVIPEGNDVDEFMGWAAIGSNKMSVNRSFLGHFLRHKKFSPDARLLGSRRAMIMSGEYDKVLPMDIMAEFLLKAIISRDIDKMESLGIYEIAPEDMALCEYVDTSKLEIQKIVREGLDYLRKELN